MAAGGCAGTTASAPIKAPASFRCPLDGAPFASCLSPTSVTGLADGAHLLQVDAAANVDPTPAAWPWTVDTAPLDTAITSGPAAVVSSASANFAFTSTAAGGTFQCSLDGAAFAACTGPATYVGLADGAHTVQVRAADAAGNADATPATLGWQVDTAAPDTAITSGPSGGVASASATFAFTSTEPGSTFECSLDGAAFAACTSPAAYTGLVEGGHTLQVRSTGGGCSQGPVQGLPGLALAMVLLLRRRPRAGRLASGDEAPTTHACSP